ncbi:SDR family oxidoreductase [Streptomyces sp. A012304]|uniref:SDR family oxidoreductase n=1 Tax=Streptomyces sp. A012304 TaxID=375446 RepID=UPI00222EA991|nr:SDR family oxidoreductase [Streptomyces sp. A012304]GKQ35331.1 short-chain dehydrogenase/reductase [Streptomyces sp. A012304]
MSVALITGTSTGIGLETALAAARRGLITYATMRDLSRSGELRERAAAEDLPVRLLTLDVTDDASVSAAVATVEDAHGAIDVLVNNAGVSAAGPVETVPAERAREVFETNVWGPVRLSRAVLPAMRERGSGVVVNLGSVAGRVPGLPHNGFYCASKHALSVLSESLAWEVAPFGIRVVSVEPDFFATRIFDRGWAGSVDTEGPYSADHAWANSYFLDGGAQAAADPAVAGEAVIAAALDPASPLHVFVGPGGPAFTEAAAAAGSFENWVTTATQIMETVAGPRPTAPAPARA